MTQERPQDTGFRPGEERPAPAVPPAAAAVPRPVPSVESAWWLALLAGFGGSALGFLIGLPGAATVFAAAAFAPVWLRHARRGRPGPAALAGLAWMMGGLGATVGMALEGGAERVQACVPLSALYVGLVPLSHGGAPGAPLLLVAGAVFVVLTLSSARVALGLPSLLLLAYGLHLVGVRAARFAHAAVEAGWEPSSAALAGAPPQHLLLLFGSGLFVTVAASPRPLLPLEARPVLDRRLFWTGALLVVLALACAPWIDRIWRGQTTL